MEETPTPWLIAEAVNASGASVMCVWVSMLVGAAMVLLGGILLCA
ncbi:hypothetical protein [Mycolicibacterium sp.]